MNNDVHNLVENNVIYGENLTPDNLVEGQSFDYFIFENVSKLYPTTSGIEMKRAT